MPTDTVFRFLHLAEIIIDSNLSLLSQQFLVTFWTTTGDPVATTTAATARASKEQKETTNKQQQADRQQHMIQHGIKVWTHKKIIPQFSKLNGCITIQTLIVQTAEIQHLLARNNTQRVKLAVSHKVSLGHLWFKRLPQSGLPVPIALSPQHEFL